mmetsp:Transcript_13899/g.16861  ORF Transcript_13899/g.16861 Transcript_13899/m.16861 type:complete len:769 (-) Transcript_13899:359-2665(-)
MSSPCDKENQSDLNLVQKVTKSSELKSHKVVPCESSTAEGFFAALEKPPDLSVGLDRSVGKEDDKEDGKEVGKEVGLELAVDANTDGAPLQDIEELDKLFGTEVGGEVSVAHQDEDVREDDDHEDQESERVEGVEEDEVQEEQEYEKVQNDEKEDERVEEDQDVEDEVQEEQEDERVEDQDQDEVQEEQEYEKVQNDEKEDERVEEDQDVEDEVQGDQGKEYEKVQDEGFNNIKQEAVENDETKLSPKTLKRLEIEAATDAYVDLLQEDDFKPTEDILHQDEDKAIRSPEVQRKQPNQMKPKKAKRKKKSSKPSRTSADIREAILLADLISNPPGIDSLDKILSQEELERFRDKVDERIATQNLGGFIHALNTQKDFCTLFGSPQSGKTVAMVTCVAHLLLSGYSRILFGVQNAIEWKNQVELRLNELQEECFGRKKIPVFYLGNNHEYIDWCRKAGQVSIAIFLNQKAQTEGVLEQLKSESRCTKIKRAIIDESGSDSIYPCYQYADSAIVTTSNLSTHLSRHENITKNRLFWLREGAGYAGNDNLRFKRLLAKVPKNLQHLWEDQVFQTVLSDMLVKNTVRALITVNYSNKIQQKSVGECPLEPGMAVLGYFSSSKSLIRIRGDHRTDISLNGIQLRQSKGIMHGTWDHKKISLQQLLDQLENLGIHKIIIIGNGLAVSANKIKNVTHQLLITPKNCMGEKLLLRIRLCGYHMRHEERTVYMTPKMKESLNNALKVHRIVKNFLNNEEIDGNTNVSDFFFDMTTSK